MNCDKYHILFTYKVIIAIETKLYIFMEPSNLKNSFKK